MTDFFEEPLNLKPISRTNLWTSGQWRKPRGHGHCRPRL